jgi:hypothetical protein
MALTALRMEVDSATFVNWSTALTSLSNNFSVPIQVLTPIPGLSKPPSSIACSGLELLKWVGQACTRPHIHDDPERLFALLRYATRIRSRASNPVLHRDLRDLDSHKKKVLSDELGCGFSFLVANRLLNADNFLDLKEAIGRYMVRTSAAKSRQPDYIATDRLQTKLIVLEAKGTQSRNYARRQIQSGCGQVSTVKMVGIPKSTNIVRVVVGTELQREDQRYSSRILVGDPEERKSSFEYEFRKPPEYLSERGNLARLSYLVGDVQLGALVDPLIQAQEAAPVALVRRQIGDREFAGSIVEIVHRSSRCGLFLGLEERVRASIAKLAGLPQFPDLPSIGMEFDRKAVGRSVHDVGKDGLAIEVWSEGPLASGSVENDAN